MEVHLSHYGRILLPQSGVILDAFHFNKKIIIYGMMFCFVNSSLRTMWPHLYYISWKPQGLFTLEERNKWPAMDFLQI